MEVSGKIKTYCVLGVMSGTSLDGLDLALVRLSKSSKNWHFELLHARSVAYSSEWKQKLQDAFSADRDLLSAADVAFGRLIGVEIQDFLKEAKIQPDFIASHGHTIIHEPENGITIQIGNANEIYRITQIPVINNFRTKDVSLGGQGAPLVPIGDRYFFPEYDFCLNLGGIANVSYESSAGRVAFDVCAFNMVINYLSQKKGLPYDDKGQLAKSGKLIPGLYQNLNSINYCNQPPPKSLGYEEFMAFWKPIIDQYDSSIEDKLRTFTEHTAYQISSAIRNRAGHNDKMLVTGGGAFNEFFISRLSALCEIEVHVPEREIIEFKEAIVFALLGVLRFRNESNCLASVTGAERDNCGGELYGF